MTKRKRVLDICCGAGGLSYGFYAHKRFDLVGGIDNDELATKTYARNYKKTKNLCADVCKLRGDDIREHFGDLDVVISGFPCQVYSPLGSRDINDRRIEVVFAVLRLIAELSPELVLFENVTSLMNFDDGRLFGQILMYLEKIGYMTSFSVLNASDFGVPQNRKRLVIVGSKKTKFSFLTKTNKDTVTVFDAWADLLGQGNNDYLRWVKKGSAVLTEHDVVRHTKNARLKINGSFGFGSSYKRLRLDQPSTTIVSSFGFLSGPKSVHPLFDRALSIREAARLQSFPDKFRFFGSKTKKRQMVANAVPPLLSIAISRMVWGHLISEKGSPVSCYQTEFDDLVVL